MDGQLEARLNKRFIKMFACDTARISQPCGMLFLIIGHNRSTKDDATQWYKNGTPIDFDYVAEYVIASGKSVRELLRSAHGYKRLLSLKDSLARRTVYLSPLQRLPPLPSPNKKDEVMKQKHFVFVVHEQTREIANLIKTLRSVYGRLRLHGHPVSDGQRFIQLVEFC